MAKILYDPSSPRGDHGKLVINNRIPISVPFTFSFNDYDSDVAYPTLIANGEYIKGVMKENIKLLNTIFEFEYTTINNNTINFVLDESQVNILRPGIEYVLGFTLFDANNIPTVPLLKSLPIEVEAIVL